MALKGKALFLCQVFTQHNNYLVSTKIVTAQFSCLKSGNICTPWQELRGIDIK